MKFATPHFFPVVKSHRKSPSIPHPLGPGAVPTKLPGPMEAKGGGPGDTLMLYPHWGEGVTIVASDRGK
jgi:hypothetical protein